MTHLGDLLADQLASADIGEPEPQRAEELPDDIPDVIDELGGRERAVEILEASEPGISHSTAVKRVWRWSTGETSPNPQHARELLSALNRSRAGRRRSEARRRSKADGWRADGASLTISGTLIISTDIRYREISPVAIGPSTMSRVLRIAKEDVDQAASQLWTAWQNAYGAPLLPASDRTRGMIGDSAGDVDQFDLDEISS